MSLPKLTQLQFERFLEELKERGVDASQMTVAKYAGDICRCAVEAGWIEMDVDQADPKEVVRVQRSIQKRVEEILAPDPN